MHSYFVKELFGDVELDANESGVLGVSIIDNALSSVVVQVADVTVGLDGSLHISSWEQNLR